MGLILDIRHYICIETKHRNQGIDLSLKFTIYKLGLVSSLLDFTEAEIYMYVSIKKEFLGYKLSGSTSSMYLAEIIHTKLNLTCQLCCYYKTI
jgi:hypothetical protein